MSVTQSQIAAALGISQRTVSEALRPEGRLRPATRQRILDQADRMGYRLNAAARAARTGRFHNVALIISEEGLFLPTGLLVGAGRALAERDMTLSVSQLPDAKLTSAGYVPRILRELMADGLLINYVMQIPPAMDTLIRGHAIPSVWINTRAQTDSVYPDDFAAGHLATRRLIERGHRRIVYLWKQAAPHYSAGDRLAGYRAAMADAGLEPRAIERAGPPSWVRRDPKDLDHGADRLPLCDALLAGDDRPTACVTYSPSDAQPLLLAAARRGVSVPQQLSIVTINDWIVDAAGVRIDCVRIPMNRLGATAVELLIRRIGEGGASVPSRAIAPDWLDGATIAEAPSK